MPFDQTGQPVYLKNISVHFGPVTALQDVTLHLAPGERHAIVGENGAGKSTLMRVLFGLQRPTTGEIVLGDTPVRLSSPAEAMRNGIGMVQQHFELIDAFTVAENILLGVESVATKGIRFDHRIAAKIVMDLSQRSGLSIDPTARVQDLSVATRQRVEILKALYRNVRILILDEPTALLSPTEADDLWRSVHHLSEEGITVAFVTHKLDDVITHANTVTVLRRGKHIATSPIQETTADLLATQIVGSDDNPLDRPIASPVISLLETTRTIPVLRLDSVTVRERNQPPTVREATLTVHSGEILGLAGVDGSGQTELLEALVGLRAIHTGKLFIKEEEATRWPTKRRRQAGIAYIPADRHRHAVALSLTCEENLILGQERSPAFSTRGFLRFPEMGRFLQDRSTTFDIRGSAVGLPIRALSGGNQQKLVLARELATKPSLLIAAQPTRGLDFAATAFVHKMLRQERDRGCAVLLQSLDLEEIISLSDRVAVMRDGRIVAVLNQGEISLERIGTEMTGAQEMAR